MNTPTPEQLQDAAIWLSQQNYQKEYGEQEYMMYFDVDIPIMLTAYANHVLTNHEGFQSNAELKRKLAALKEESDELRQQLTDARKEIEGLKERMTRARSILTKDNPTSTNNWAMLDVSDNTPTT